MSLVTDMKAVVIAATGNVGPYRTEIVDATSGAITRTLPSAAASEYKKFTFVKKDSSANAVTIAADGSDTINGVASIELSAQYENVSLVCDAENSAWYIV